MKSITNCLKHGFMGLKDYTGIKSVKSINLLIRDSDEDYTDSLKMEEN